jgi:micrococcal nuclease
MKYFCILLLLVTGSTAFSQIKISASDASKHIGDSVTITAQVSGSKVFDNGMTLLNIGGKFPNHLLTVMIPQKVKATFSFKPEVEFHDEEVTVTGKLIEYKGKPEIMLSTYSQIQLTARE